MSMMKYCDICNKNEKQVKLDKYEMRKRNKFRAFGDVFYDGSWKELDICTNCMDTIKTAMRDGIESVKVESTMPKDDNVL